MVFSVAALSQTNGVVSSKRSFTHAEVHFDLGFKDTNYVVSAIGSGGKTDKVFVAQYRTNCFRLFCPIGTTNITWTVKHR